MSPDLPVTLPGAGPRGSSRPRESALRIVVLYPDLLGTYGDIGNAIVLRERCVTRGIACELVRVDPGEAVPSAGDVYLLGGAEDAGEAAAARLLRADRGLFEAVDAGATVLAVCAGFQLLGTTFETSGGATASGLGILDVRTTAASVRAVGDVFATPDGLPGLPALIGFENHQGATTLGPTVQPLARVSVGTGNGSPDRAEGAVQGHVIGTYLHGPVLALNPALADHLIAQVAGPLSPLDDELAARARARRRQVVRAA